MREPKACRLALSARTCFTGGMDEAQTAARDALDATVELCTARGLDGLWRNLVQDVYASNLGRHEPEELGDTSMTLGIQCSENLKVRAGRRFRHDDLERAEDHWDVDDLTVATPANTLTFVLSQARVVVMKVPHAQGRAPLWDHFGDWQQDSQVRLQVAATNSHTLGGYRTKVSAEVPLFSYGTAPAVVKDYMLVWAGEPSDPRTAGWLTVPVLGDTPFIARTQLWWDEEPTARTYSSAEPSRGPSFDERQVAGPQVTLKPRPAARDQS
ncbi:hypothetical protein GCM10022197_22000 [Microlunatus spumicola]|uniref:Uncharacterized protein n=1 Tax=Microlunatus spumicola TaxID=81499 RepID=A0ABP6XE20_9ACTN